MCLNPILIDNPNYRSPVSGSDYANLHDTIHKKMPVPCGRCPVCLALKQQYLVQRVQMESMENDLYFGTLTYNEEMIPRLYVNSEITIAYADISDFQNMIKLIRKHENLGDFKFFAVTEYGGKRHRPHFHFILSFPKIPGSNLADRESFAIKLHSIFLKYWRRNVNYTDKLDKKGNFKRNTRNPIWKNLCTYHSTHRGRNFDLHYLNPNSSSSGVDDVAFYVTKYMLKYDTWLDKLRSKLYFTLPDTAFKSTWDIIKPHRLISKHFGSAGRISVIEHIFKGIDLAVNDSRAMYPYYISPVNGATFPLCPYYCKRFLRPSELALFRSRRPMYDEDPDLDSIHKQTVRFDKVCTWLDNLHTLEDDSMNFQNTFNTNTNGNNKENIPMDNDFARDWQDF